MEYRDVTGIYVYIFPLVVWWCVSLGLSANQMCVLLFTIPCYPGGAYSDTPIFHTFPAHVSMIPQRKLMLSALNVIVIDFALKLLANAERKPQNRSTAQPLGAREQRYQSQSAAATMKCQCLPQQALLSRDVERRQNPI